ncbi:hypothetical protein MAC_09717 [Metarhizium acridum CQMa 102]|uniref:Protein kinase domain-containing protein n=1 Tax=Metarhizium acridum (strain CQMa 102) TaxID=655827 RepID=E9EIL9_METAQ|nr:uncharacterized protein MAC_09717 [Metarhizium acridum CQMa 102]EFY84239.1 hypothetical protein MAC_09717 [Metarhizium acridum CQMa 102]
MHPDWPESFDDLVPLPQCPGPKLKPFDFLGPQKIDFLEYLGQGLHSFVFKVEILGNIYALKLFRFDYVREWIGPAETFDQSDTTALNTIYNYAEPFNCECRSFGRLQEAGYEELSVKCFGYLLLDEEHERTMMEKFSDNELEFNGNVYDAGYDDIRASYAGKSGRPPPIRGILKEFGSEAKNLKTKDMRKVLRDVKRFHQLGIINLDVADRQLINGKLCDFSTAITVPHFITTPELNPHLPPIALPALAYETFLITINDYWTFDDMVRLWNLEHEDQKTEITVFAFPNGRGCRIDYNLRSTPSRDRVYTFVDPRTYNWKASVTSPGPATSRTRDGPRTRQSTNTERQQQLCVHLHITKAHVGMGPSLWLKGSAHLVHPPSRRSSHSNAD